MYTSSNIYVLFKAIKLKLEFLNKKDKTYAILQYICISSKRESFHLNNKTCICSFSLQLCKLFSKNLQLKINRAYIFHLNFGLAQHITCLPKSVLFFVPQEIARW